jgi:hypothetical protein
VQLADFNIARLRASLDDPSIADFRDNLDAVNALADESPGFVWRLQDEHGDATSFNPYGDELVIVNLAVWESVDALADFTYKSRHVEFLRRRREWFEAPGEPILCLWWIDDGTLPTVEDGVERLALLRATGPTPEAFTFHHRFDPP